MKHYTIASTSGGELTYEHGDKQDMADRHTRAVVAPTATLCEAESKTVWPGDDGVTSEAADGSAVTGKRDAGREHIQRLSAQGVAAPATACATASKPGANRRPSTPTTCSTVPEGAAARPAV